MMAQLIALPGRVLERWYTSPFVGWISARTWRAALLLATIAYCFAFPSYDVVLILNEMEEAWRAIFQQVSAPFTDHSALYDPESHSSKLGFRFVPALLLKALGIDTIVGALLVQAGFVVVFYGLLFNVFRQLITQPSAAFILSLPVCFVIAGHVHASDYRGIFDIVALCLLLAATLLRRTPWVIPAVILAGFTDERALMASPTLILLELYLSGRYLSMRETLRVASSRPVVLLIVSWCSYFVLRFSLGRIFGLETASVDLLHYFGANLQHIPYAVYIAGEGYYLLIGAVFMLLMQRKAHAFLTLFTGQFLLLLLFALCVVDINRSLSYLIVWLVLITVILYREKPLEVVLGVCGWCLLINLAYADFYPLPLQIFRMAFVTDSLFPLDGWTWH